tara:strand:- start:2446 stop:2868 length:423 start_codon:yes stop_codon:yes gene_type:complete
MGNWWDDRTFYEDPEEDLHFKKYYAPRMYCKHSQPCYRKCWACEKERREEQESYYQAKVNTSKKGFKFFFEPDFDPCDRSYCYEDDMDKAEFCDLRQCSTITELKKEYYKLCRLNHPDKGGDEEIFKRLNNLYHDLMNHF